jgi:hypothetical protein
MVHVDAEGFGTVVKPICGLKYWVVLRPKRNLSPGDIGDQASMYAYPLGWSHGNTGHGIFRAEGVLLRPGDNLYV